MFAPKGRRPRGSVGPLQRALVYGLAGCFGELVFTTVEYLSERLLRRLLGRAPWDYSRARWQLDGLIRFDYFPLWAAAGLATERLP